jgi:Protein of unknown function (DUF3301)
MTELVIFTLIVGPLALLWQANTEARARAHDAARDACERASLQLLDDAVVLKSWRLGRDRAGRLGLERTYLFDYSDDGAGRHQGFVVLRGHVVEIVGLGPTLVSARDPERST